MTQADFVKRARARLKMTQVELASALDINIRTIKRWENGDGVDRIAVLAIERLLDLAKRRRSKKKQGEGPKHVSNRAVLR